MDIVTVFTIITPVVLAVVGGWVKSLHSRMNIIEARHESLDRDYRAHLADLPNNFVAKDDYREDVREIKETLRQLVQHIVGHRA